RAWPCDRPAAGLGGVAQKARRGRLSLLYPNPEAFVTGNAADRARRLLRKERKAFSHGSRRHPASKTPWATEPAKDPICGMTVVVKPDGRHAKFK
ncbi:MAG: hypothetical protein ABR504_10770, partial [Paracoccaceae bacterium]